MDEISSKYTFTQYSIMILTNFYSYGCRNPIIRDKNSLYYILANIRCWKWSFGTENCRKSKILRMIYPLNIFLHNIASWYWQISTDKVAKFQLFGTKIHYTKFLANIRLWKWSFSTENGRKSNIVRMKYPLNIFLLQYSIMISTNFYW